MNQILQLKGQFQQKKNDNKPGPRNLPQNTYVSVAHMNELLQQLLSIQKYWLNNPIIKGALISVHYNRIVAKSNRLQGLLGHKSGNPNETICGSRFSDDYPLRHIFTHYVAIDDIKEAIRRLNVAKEYVKAKFGQQISHDSLEQVNKGRIPYAIADSLARSNFAKVIVDCFYVNKFDIDMNTEPLNETAIITIYKTNVQTKELLTNLGINMIEAKMIDDTTIRLSSNELKILRDKAPYLIAMQTHDISELSLEDIQACPSNIIQIKSPTNEPVIGVIDTPFYDDVYFKEWVTYENKIDKNIELQPSDYIHGTEVSSIIVDGPKFNPDLEDGCGNFRVKHFGVAKSGPFSSFSVLKAIREVVAENRDIKVWNLSLGSVMEIQRNFISPEAAELDRIQNEYDVVFVVAGTNKPSNREGNMLIGAPADSLNSIVVNSVNEFDEAASYHRNGPVLSFFHKPDISYYGGDRSKGIHVCTPTGEGFVTGTSFAAPWITRKVAYLIYNMGLTREIAKALLIDSAAGWQRKDDISNSIGYGVVPKHINSILQTPDDEIRFMLTGSSEEYETYNYNIPVPIVDNKQPFYARATLCYYPKCKRTQGVDYTSTEMDIHFGRVYETNKENIDIKSINKNCQGNTDAIGITEDSARREYRKWDNIKLISESIKNKRIPKTVYGAGMWGLSIKTKERIKGGKDKGLQFGVVVTLKEMKGKNRIDDFIKLCMMRGWIVNRFDVEHQNDVFAKGEEKVTFE
jgi:hypothetical protein